MEAEVRASAGEQVQGAERRPGRLGNNGNRGKREESRGQILCGLAGYDKKFGFY